MAGGIPQVVLNSGLKMPIIGFGTATMPMASDELESNFVNAIEAGYRHFDAARIYGTEQNLGRAIKEALRRGLIKGREELFITSKLWCTHAHHDLVLPGIKETLSNLGLEYLDLYLIHWPVRLKHTEPSFYFEKSDLLPFEMVPTWEAMEECQKLGLTKSIGVSNFSCKKLTDLLAVARIPPAVNQVEMNVGWQQKKLNDFCKDKGIVLCAWSPLGGTGAMFGSYRILDNPILDQVAQARGKSKGQVALRWLYEKGVVIISKSFNKERMIQNLQIFDWELSADDLRKIDEFPQKKGNNGEMFVGPDGQYKTVEELWDGEK
ncbi:hypothetical protein QJS04_geneDACA017147 [Acorus gramineus]|uniref:NADP-dependent oxidoreductase domain-containing protein n=1 Tax=Acorus gramineus TaxID=55184 RepID=A0AAV9BNY6_ACOGR|nr:hypothetical protein QJS04_geneDACA017147 [Acorus gramineus]